MIRNDTKMAEMLHIISNSSAPVKIDTLSDQLGMNRRSVQNYIYAARNNGVNLVSMPGRQGGVRIGK